MAFQGMKGLEQLLNFFMHVENRLEQGNWHFLASKKWIKIEHEPHDFF